MSILIGIVQGVGGWRLARLVATKKSIQKQGGFVLCLVGGEWTDEIVVVSWPLPHSQKARCLVEDEAKKILGDRRLFPKLRLLDSSHT